MLGAGRADPGRAVLRHLQADPGRAGSEGILEEIAKLDRIRAVGLPPDLFEGISPRVLRAYWRRAAVGEPHEVPTATGYRGE